MTYQRNETPEPLASGAADEFEALMPELHIRRATTGDLYTADQLRAAMQSMAERAAKKERDAILQLALTKTAMFPSDSDYTRGYALAKNDFAAAIRAREGKGATG